MANAGAVLDRLGKRSEAVAKFLQAAEIYGQIGMPVERGKLLGNLATALGLLGRDGFVTACEKAGMSRKDAGKLAGQLQSESKPQSGGA